MTGKQFASILSNELINRGFLVHRYNAYSTSSIYLKLDFRCCLWYKNCRPPGKEKI